MITESLQTLKIHKLTQEQYDRELEAGRIDENALYLTPNDNDIYIQNDEPLDAVEGSLWIDLDDDTIDSSGTTSGGITREELQNFIDSSLTLEGKAADAKATGDAINSLNNIIDNLSDVATSGDYNDLSNLPTIPDEYVHPESHPASMITGLAAVATSNDYNDLSNKPTIPSISGLATEAYVDEKIASIDNVNVETDTTLTISGKAADAKATGDAINSLNTLVGEIPVSEQIADAIEDAITEVYVQNDEPTDAPDGSIWVDTDADGAPTTSGKTSANVYVMDAATTDITTIDFSQYKIGDVILVTAS